MRVASRRLVVAGLAPASPRYQREVNVLVDDLVDLAPSLRSADDAESLVAQADAYDEDHLTRDNWQASKWLIDTRKTANQQLLIGEESLDKARRLEQLAANTDLPSRRISSTGSLQNLSPQL